VGIKKTCFVAPSTTTGHALLESILRQTNTFCCFSSKCNAGTGDVIEFIRLMDKSSNHEAILKAKSLLGNAETRTEQPEQLSRVAEKVKTSESKAGQPDQGECHRRMDETI